MAKYDSALGNLKDQITAAKSVLIALPAQPSIDTLSAGLALYLSLKQISKEVSIVSESNPTVSVSNLYGIGQLSNALPKTDGGNLTLTLEGVVASDGTVPALEKLDWFPQGNNLNLVFHVLPGQSFKPSQITPTYTGGGFNLIFSIGASSLNSLGGVYSNNTQIFSGVSLVNIDNSPANTQYGAINVVDSSSTQSGIIMQVIQGLGLPLDAEGSSNLLAGIYGATSNLTIGVNPETFMLISQLMQIGGRLPQIGNPAAVAVAAEPAAPILEPNTPAADYAQSFPPLNQVFGFPIQSEQPQSDNFIAPGVVNSSPEERPVGEVAISSNPETQTPEPDWLTPKVFKGGNIG